MSKEIVAAAAGGFYTVALLKDDSVIAWGNNDRGQLGDGATISRFMSGPVKGLKGRVVSVAAGGQHTVALLEDGSIVGWGRNGEGQLGDGTTQDRLGPAPVKGLEGQVVAIATGGFHTVALLKDGSVWAWGRNTGGQLGDGTYENRLEPVPVKGLKGKVIAISAGFDHTVALLKNGSVVSWGMNYHGQLGDGTGKDSLRPVVVRGLTRKVVAISAGENYVVALLGDGSVVTWGDNLHGQLGDGTTMNKPKPVPVLELRENVVAVATGWDHTIALLEDDSVWAWGHNEDGQLWDGTRDDRNCPVPVILTERRLIKACFDQGSGRTPGLLGLEKVQRALTAADIGL